MTLNVSTTDNAGRPVSADVAVWSVDKAIFELSDNTLGDIFKAFWSERYLGTAETHSLEGITVQQAERGGGCFAAGTKVLMADGSIKNIEEVKVGDYILTRKNSFDKELVKAKISGVESAVEGGYLIVNSRLRITADHILQVNGKWEEAGSIQKGDSLVGADGEEVKVESVEWQMGKFDVYNLGVEKYHTFFADGVWVHNQKGIERTVFKDTAYWNPSVHTDSAGKAVVRFKLPDNLTTWVVAAVADTADTRVGQATSEVKVTKDLIVRPILPNILRVGDEAVVTAVVQNFTQLDDKFDIGLQFDSGEVGEATYSARLIKHDESEQLSWHIKPKSEKEKAKLIFSARSTSDKKLGDVVTQEIPVKEFGFEESRAEVGNGPQEFTIKLAADAHLKKSSATLSIAPTILGALPSAMKYLVSYPYGCVEQTTSRFVPAVIAKANSALFSQALEDKDISAIIDKGIERLTILEQGDGGWSWWFSGRSDYFITAYVTEYLLEAKKLGVLADDQLLQGAERFLESAVYIPADSSYRENEREVEISKAYGLALLGSNSTSRKRHIDNLDGLSPDLLAFAVTVNVLNGDKNSSTNGLAKLEALAQTQGDGVFWNGGDKLNFGSRDASTALAIRAILSAGGDRELAVKGARYLTRNRKSDYWSNTFATAQVIRALVELSKTGQELVPNYSYSVKLDDKEIASGVVSNSNQVIKDIDIPVAQIKESSKLSVTKQGDGQIYTTLLIKEFHTDKNAKAVSNGLSVSREYVNDKGVEYSIGVGDTVTVRVTVSGLGAQENFGVVADELPAGLVPVNPRLKNEQENYRPDSYYYSYGVSDSEVTENGMVMSLYQMAAGEYTYTYKARAVSEGRFLTPPAVASLMYAPEIHGRSKAEVVEIDKDARVIPERIVKKNVGKVAGSPLKILLLILAVLIIIGVIIYKKKRLSLVQIKEWFKDKLNRNKPPTPPLPDNTGQSSTSV